MSGLDSESGACPSCVQIPQDVYKAKTLSSGFIRY